MSGNFRFNPFTGQLLGSAISGEAATISLLSDYGIYGVELLEVPDIATPVTIAPQSPDTTIYTEVSRSVAPSSGQFRVDYYGAGNYGMGIIEFNGAQNGKSILITYKGTGRNVNYNTLFTGAVITGATFTGTVTSTTVLSGLTGMIVGWPVETPPTGWLECNGASLLRASYADLFAVIGVTFGAADGTHFTLPDLRGKFVRGWAHGQTTDPDRASRTDRGDGTTGDHVGTKQVDSYKAHTHTYANAAGSGGLSGGGAVGPPNTDSTGVSGDNETRPLNVNMMYCIKT